MNLRVRIMLVMAITIGALFSSGLSFAQQKAKLRQIRIALPSQTIGATHYLCREKSRYLRTVRP